MTNIPFSVMVDGKIGPETETNTRFFIAAHKEGTLGDPVIIERRYQWINSLTAKKSSWPPYPLWDSFSRGYGGTISEAGSSKLNYNDTDTFYSTRYQAVYDLSGLSRPIYAVIESTLVNNEDYIGTYINGTGGEISLQWFKGPPTPALNQWGADTNWGIEFWGDFSSPASRPIDGPYIKGQTIVWPLYIDTLNMGYENFFFLAEPNGIEPLTYDQWDEEYDNILVSDYNLSCIYHANTVMKLYY